MSRHGYTDDCDGWQLIMYRGAVTSAIKGARGQKLLTDLAAALDAMPDKRLIAHELVRDGEVCALGCVGLARGLDLEHVDPEDADTVAKAFNVAPALAREIVYINDEWGRHDCTPEDRWKSVRKWVEEHLKPQQPSPA